MYRNMRSDRFPRLRTYADALNHEAGIKPLRSKYEYRNGAKPLAERKRNWLQIRKDGDDVVIKLHSTDVIRYKPDNTIIVRQDSYCTPTTHETIGAILDVYIVKRNGAGWVMLRDGSYKLHTVGDNVFKLANTSLWFTNPALAAKHKLKRKEYAAWLKRYKAFTTYAIGATKLRENCKFSWDEYRETFASAPLLTINKHFIPNSHQLLGYMDNEDNWYRALLCIYHNCKQYHWRGVSPVSEVKRVISEVIKFAKRDEIFIEEEVIHKVIPKDCNAKYF